MKQGIYKIKENTALTADVYKMIISNEDNCNTAITAPGQFINIKIEGLYLRRPISICDYDDTNLTIIYKVVGKGTEVMSKMEVGLELDVLVGLGNGYDLTASGQCPVLIGGGVGIPPMYNLCRELKEQGKEPIVILGFNKKEEIFLKEDFEKLAKDVYITTVDGSVGIKGFVTDAMSKIDYTYFYTCGPLPMFKAINKVATTSGQLSFEERMGCGFGACMGCSCKTTNGYKRICKEGPVLLREEILWEQL